MDLNRYADKDADWFDRQYNLLLHRPDFQSRIVPDRDARSKQARTELTCKIDLRYGAGARQLLDVFLCGQADAPTLIFIHGGYWYRGDKSAYSYLARPFVQAGINVVIPTYDLCPKVKVTDISEELREAVGFTFMEAESLGLNRDRIAIAGHSAGGHLTQMMLGTDWSGFSYFPPNLIKAAIPISPISFLEPIRCTKDLNEHVQLDAVEAEQQSPLIHHPPLVDCPVLVAVGEAETEEFHYQAESYAQAFTTSSRAVSLRKISNVDHFDILNDLADPSSAFFVEVTKTLHDI